MGFGFRQPLTYNEVKVKMLFQLSFGHIGFRLMLSYKKLTATPCVFGYWKQYIFFSHY